MSKLEQVFYSAVGELTGIWVTINGERHLFSKESIIREQIAREILARKESKKLSCAPSNIQLCQCDIGRAYVEAAAIARGEG